MSCWWLRRLVSHFFRFFSLFVSHGWCRCNAYNISTACACLLCIAFVVSVFFDVKDLHASRTSPRTRI
jgi:hypothetical protein